MDDIPVTNSPRHSRRDVPAGGSGGAVLSGVTPGATEANAMDAEISKPDDFVNAEIRRAHAVGRERISARQPGRLDDDLPVGDGVEPATYRLTFSRQAVGPAARSLGSNRAAHSETGGAINEEGKLL